MISENSDFRGKVDQVDNLVTIDGFKSSFLQNCLAWQSVARTVTGICAANCYGRDVVHSVVVRTLENLTHSSSVSRDVAYHTVRDRGEAL